MKKTRLEAFSDAVLAILLTILVLELKVPETPTFAALVKLWPVYVAYLLSFLTIFMMWMTHHNIFNAFEKVNHQILWANGFFLFAVSQLPFVTAFVGETRWDAELPVMLYGIAMMTVSLSLIWLKVSASTVEEDAPKAQRHDHMPLSLGVVFSTLYLFAALLAWVHPLLSLAIYAVIPLSRLFSSPSYRYLD